MSYENAPATKLLATHCCACGRPLVDSVSVSAGMGPDCREKYGYYAEAPEEARAEANAIVHAVAANPKAADLPVACARLSALGFSVLSAKLIGRLAKVVVSEAAGMFSVKTPYSEAVVAAMRSVPGRRWNKEAKVNEFPVSQKAALFAILKKHFNGETAVGPKGAFVIGAVAAPLASEAAKPMLYKDMSPEQQAEVDHQEDERERFKGAISAAVEPIIEALVDEEVALANQEVAEAMYVDENGNFDCTKLERDEERQHERTLREYRRTGVPVFSDLTDTYSKDHSKDKYRR